MDTISKLQFKHHSEIITGATLQEAEDAVKSYIYNQWFDTAAYNDPNSDYRSLYAEPTVFRYAVEGEEEGKTHIMLLIGAETNDGSREDYNKFCIINIDKTEQEIADLAEELEKAIKSLTVVALDTNTLDLHAEKTDEGTFVSGDVKTASHHVFDDITKYNNLMVASDGTDGPEGLFIYVDLTYDEAAESFTFVVTNADGTLKKQEVKLPNNYLVSGRYSVQDQSLHLKMNNGDDVVVDCTYLIAEWDTEKDGSKTPIVLVKEPVGYGEESEYYHLEPWQDVLRADIRLKDEIKDDETGKYIKDPNSSNILERTLDGRSLYVDGKASNIIYYWNGEKSNVKDQLDKFNQIGVSDDADNIIWNRADKFFAAVKLDYDSTKNSLTFTTSNVGEPHMRVKEIPLNTVEVFKYIYYDATTEELVLAYTNDKGEEKVVRTPLSGMIDEWDVLNEAHSVYLKKQRNVSGKDLLSADVKISSSDNNILTEINHELYVRGTSDNIKYDVTGNTTVKDVLDGLKAEDEALNDKIDNEIARAEAADQELTDKIGTGFTSDQHENVTYKFEQLQNQVNTEAEKLQNEIDRSTEKDAEHDEKLAEQQAEIEAISADSANSLKDITNNDHSIDVDKTDSVRPVIKVNLSEHEPYNTIRLESDGLYNFIDLEYDSDTNKLTFIRSDKDSTENKTKEIQLNSVPFDITYDKNREVLIITYHTSEGEKTVEIDLHGLIHDEWKVYNDPNSAVKLDKSESVSGTDILSAEVVLSPRSSITEDNIIENVNGALYVPANTNVTEALSSAINSVDTKVDNEITRAISAETALSGAISTVQTNLQTEIDRATAAETRIETSLNNEISRAQTKENELNSAITAETLRAQAADNELYHDLSDETAARAAGDAELLSKINQESSRAQVAETTISEALNSEITRSTAKDNDLEAAINAESQRAQTAEAALEDAIEAATLTFHDTTSINFNDPQHENNVVKADVKVANAPSNIILIDGQKDGLYASVGLQFDHARNVLNLVINGQLQPDIPLGAGSIIDGAGYDNETKELIIYYHSADQPDVQKEVRIPSSDFYNEWIVQNPSENSAVELTKRTGIISQGIPQPDELSGRVLISPLEDNLLTIDTNGLYVSGSEISGASETAECANKKADKLYELLYGYGSSMAGCGENTEYRPYASSCIISAATSFNDADKLLNDQICEILSMWVSGATPTNTSTWVEDGANRKIQVDARLSHGNHNGMSDDELVITTNDGIFEEPGKSGFTNTNVLRVVNISEGPDHTVLPPDNPYNGLYLSNDWDCGLYYDADVDAEAIIEAENAGYDTTNYRTDTDPSSSGYNYMNNVRQHDIPVE